jgi:tetratricopeptide (TPR) repeat protein
VTATSGPLKPDEVTEVARLAKAAIELGGNDDIALTDAASVVGYILGDYQGALLLGARAIALNPNSAYAWFIQSWNLHFVGQFDPSIEHCRRAIELSPQDPLMFLLETKMAWANFAKHHYEDALAWSESALGRNPENLEALFSSVASLAMLGRQTEAENKLARLLQVDPACTQTAFARTTPSSEPGYIEHWLEALRRAGMAH